MLVGILISAVTVAEGWGGLSSALYDARFNWARRPATGSVVLVEIDEKSLAAIGVWPWSRRFHAAITDRLREARAAEIAFDVDFSSRSTDDADTAFEAALQRADGSVVLAAERQRSSASSTALEITRPLARFEANAWIALVDVAVERDGAVRTMFFGAHSGPAVLPTMPALLAGSGKLRTDNFGIDFSIDLQTFDRISAVDLLANTVRSERVAGKKVIIAATSPVLKDFFQVPRYGPIPGGLIQAVALDSLLQNRALTRTGKLTSLVGVAALFLLGMILIQILPVGKAIVAAISASVACETAATLLQTKWPISIDTSAWHVSIVCLLLLAVAVEIVQRRRLWLAARAEKRGTQAILDRVFEDSILAILIADQNGQLRAVSRAAVRMLGLGSSAPILRRAAAEVLPEPIYRVLAAEIGNEGQVSRAEPTGFCELAEAHGAARTFEYTRSTSSVSEADSRDRPERVVCLTLNDVTEQRAAQEHIARLARFDVLTGLPNRNHFIERLAVLDSPPLASLLLLDIDRLKLVNSSFGQSCGDALLEAVAWRLCDVSGPDSFVARLGGAEFAVLTMTGCSDGRADEIRIALSRPYDVQGRRLVVGFSLGVAALHPGLGPDEATKRAALALSAAKAAGGKTSRSYNSEMDAALQARETLERDLSRALQQGEFRVFYQAQANLRTSRITGAEALVRWCHPEQGILLPDRFVPVLERTGLIVELGAWIMRRACLDALLWPASVRLAVNVAVPQLTRGDFTITLAGALEASGLESSRLDIELTETLFLQDQQIVTTALAEVREMGVGIALDDFGTGYSSLSYIKRFPITKIKVDRAFVRDLPADRESIAIIQAVTAMARSLDLKVVAEGVETREQLDVLRNLGCDEAQGYFISRPVTDRGFTELLAMSQ